MSWRALVAATVTVAVTVAAASGPTATAQAHPRPTTTEFATYAAGPCTDEICGTGSTIGPDGALYVTDGSNGRIQRVDTSSGKVTTFADGLPKAIAGIVGGGVIDIAFRGQTPYVLVVGVNKFFTDLAQSPQVPAADGVYRLDRVGSGRTRATLVADLYTWSEQHPPVNTGWEVFVPGGYTYAMETYRDGFLVTDAHHNRVLRVRVDGRVSSFLAFSDNVVPTGLEQTRGTVLIGQAGPIPHLPEAGRVVAVRRSGGSVRPVADGAPLLVDVEVGAHGVYGLSQGFWPYAGQSGKEGFPAAPHTGMLMRADRHGWFETVAFHLDRPTTFEIVGNTAYVITIAGKVLKINGL